jgi:hypothetical protein
VDWFRTHWRLNALLGFLCVFGVEYHPVGRRGRRRL